MARLKFGSHLPNTVPYPVARQIAQAADGQRWNSLWTYDHVYSPWPGAIPAMAKILGETEETPCLDGWVLLSALAAETKRITLGCMVSANTFRNPALLAKMAATADVVSNGRTVLGLGAAWHEGEHKAYGFPFYTVKERQDRMEEAAQVLRKLFRSEGRVSHQGTFYRLEQAPFAPKGSRPGGPPVMIGGSGEKRTLRTLAMYGDVMNVGGTPAEVRHKIQVLEQHCEAVGRNPAEIRKTIGTMVALVDSEAERVSAVRQFATSLSVAYVNTLPIGTAQQIIDHLGPYVEVGIDEVIFITPSVQPEFYEHMDRDVLSAFSG